VTVSPAFECAFSFGNILRKFLFVLPDAFDINVSKAAAGVKKKLEIFEWC